MRCVTLFCLLPTVKRVPGNEDDLASAEKTKVWPTACQCASPPPLPPPRLCAEREPGSPGERRGVGDSGGNVCHSHSFSIYSPDAGRTVCLEGGPCDVLHSIDGGATCNFRLYFAFIAPGRPAGQPSLKHRLSRFMLFAWSLRRQSEI